MNISKKTATILQIKNWLEVNIEYVLKNRSILLLADEKESRSNNGLKKILKKLFEIKHLVYVLSFACAKERTKEKHTGNDIQPLPEAVIKLQCYC